MEALKTLRIPIHYLTTRRKLQILDRLTARITYGVNLFSTIISKKKIYTRKQLGKFTPIVARETSLSSAYLQQCEDRALWMWKSYNALHRKWETKVKTAKGKRLQKLLRREPSPPGQTTKKTPVRIDIRTGQVREVSLTLTSHVLKLSTLKKFQTATMLLNPSKYHKDILAKNKSKGFEIVARKKKGKQRYFAHVLVSIEVPDQPIRTLQGVDLGIRRTVATVSLPLMPSNFALIHDGKLRHLQKLNDRISHLKRLKKLKALKNLRNKRLNYSKDHDRKTAKAFVTEYCQESKVIIGHPYLIAYNHYKGDGNKRRRKTLQRWAFRRMATYIQQACTSQGIQSKIVNEWWTSSKCHKCQGNVIRESRRIVCQKCGLQYDADFNACINIMLKQGNAFLESSPLMRRGLQMNQPEVQMIRPQKPMSAQTLTSGNPSDFSQG